MTANWQISAVRRKKRSYLDHQKTAAIMTRVLAVQVSDISMKALLNRIIGESPLARTWIISTASSSRILSLRVNARQERAP